MSPWTEPGAAVGLFLRMSTSEARLPKRCCRPGGQEASHNLPFSLPTMSAGSHAFALTSWPADKP